MKKYSLILLLIFEVWSMKAQTNVYHPFAYSNVKWRYQNADGCNGGACIIDYQYRASGDTLINGNKYAKIYVDVSFAQCQCLPQSSQPFQTPGTYFVCGIRNDTLNKKVYKTHGASEKLIYNFDLNIGDTLIPCLSPIIKIDSVLVGSNYRKRFISLDSNRVIEGIGNVGLNHFGMEGELFRPSCGPHMSPNNTFICYSHNADYYILPNAGLFLCNILSNFEKVEFDFGVTISPNPSSGVFKIETNISEKINIEITDIFGRVVQCIEINNQILQLDLSNDNNGIYFVRVMDGKGNVVVKKIIKQ